MSTDAERWTSRQTPVDPAMQEKLRAEQAKKDSLFPAPPPHTPKDEQDKEKQP